MEVVIKDNKTGKAVNAKTGVEILKNNIGDKLKNNSGINITDIGEGEYIIVFKDDRAFCCCASWNIPLYASSSDS